MSDEGTKRREFIKASATAAAGLVFVKPGSVYGTPANDADRAGHHRLRRPRQRRRPGPDEGGRSASSALHDLFDDRLAETREQARQAGRRRRACRRSIRAHALQGAGGLPASSSARGRRRRAHHEPALLPPRPLRGGGGRGQTRLPREAGGHATCTARSASRRRAARARARSAWPWASRAATPRPTRRWSAASTPAPSATSCARRPTTTRTTSSGRRRPACRPLEARVRNWVFDRVLSGDILVEQNIHVLDIVNWVMRGHPVCARATGGKKARLDVDCWDHFNVVYTYPGQRARELQLHAVQEQLRRQDPALPRHQGLRGGQLRQGRRAHRGRGALGRRRPTDGLQGLGARARRRRSWRASARRTTRTRSPAAWRARSPRSSAAPPPTRATSGPGTRWRAATRAGRRRSTSRPWPRPESGR